jgi:hypothetical protein
MNPVLQEHLAYLKLADIAAQCEPLAAEAACPASRIWLNPEVEFVRLGPEVIWSIGGLS